MANINMSNYGFVEGRLTKNPAVFKNADGSCKVAVTIAAQDNFKRKDGSRSSQFIPLERLIPASKDGKLGVYDLMHKGDLVAIQYSVRNNNYTDKAGEPHYDITLNIENVQLKESKAVTDKRQADAVAAAAAPEAETAENDKAEAEAEAEVADPF